VRDKNSVVARCDVLVAEDSSLLGRDAVPLVEYLPTFPKILLPLSSRSSSPGRIICGLFNYRISKRREPLD
jgi:hypothetical protein